MQVMSTGSRGKYAMIVVGISLADGGGGGGGGGGLGGGCNPPFPPIT